jgi:hypothetical protein
MLAFSAETKEGGNRPDKAEYPDHVMSRDIVDAVSWVIVYGILPQVGQPVESRTQRFRHRLRRAHQPLGEQLKMKTANRQPTVKLTVPPAPKPPAMVL